MATEPSPYALAAGRLRDMGYHAMPAKPGEKVPGHFEAGRWSHMARWQDWCSRMPPEFLHERNHSVACWWANDHAFETVQMEVNEA